MGPATKTIATGGQAPLIVRGSRFLKEADERPHLEGLQMIWQQYQQAMTETTLA